jgi:hypothetical protein
MAIPNSTGKYVINSPSKDLQLIFDAFGVKLEIKDNTLSVAEIKKLNNAIAKVKKLT